MQPENGVGVYITPQVPRKRPGIDLLAKEIGPNNNTTRDIGCRLSWRNGNDTIYPIYRITVSLTACSL